MPLGEDPREPAPLRPRDGADGDEAEAPAALWEPLRNSAFRTVWLSSLACNIGGWMHTVGAQWLLVGQPDGVVLVALVQTATLLPMLFFSLPAGALADNVDQRRLLLCVGGAQAACAGALTVLTALGAMPSGLLLALTFVLGAGVAVTVPTWQAALVEVVPRRQLTSAAVLGSISFNLSRVVGPAIAGALLAWSSAAAVFAVNGVALTMFTAAIWRWRPAARAPRGPRERVLPAVRAGGRYVWHDPVARRLLVRVAWFAAPASAIWALLPVVADRRLAMSPGGYGTLLGALGAGAVLGGLLLPTLRRRVAINGLLAGATLAYAVAVLAVTFTGEPVVAAIALVPAGTAWVAVLATLNAIMQGQLPRWVRGRGMAMYLLTNAGIQAVFAAAWGLIAQHAGVRVALLASAAALTAGAATIGWWPLRMGPRRGNQPAGDEPAESPADPRHTDGPIRITVTYTVPAGNQQAFIGAMRHLRKSRLRTGATRWELARDLSVPDLFSETYVLSTWEDYRRHRGQRRTETDRLQDAEARALADGATTVAYHLVVGLDGTAVEPTEPAASGIPAGGGEPPERPSRAGDDVTRAGRPPGTRAGGRALRRRPRR